MFLGESTKVKTDHSSEAPIIAPKGMFTDAWEWMSQLKIGDRIDCCDEYFNWYTAYISDTEIKDEEVDVEGNPLMKFLISFRYFDKEFGHRKDSEGRDFVGWS
jgi:hypothetical protein